MDQPMMFDENGFLGGRIDVWKRRHRSVNRDLLKMAESLNRECHAFFLGHAIGTFESFRLTGFVLFARMLELYQGVLLLVDRGSRSGTRILFRSFLEAYFHFSAIHKDPAYLAEYLEQFEVDRKSLVKRIHKTEDKGMENLRRPITPELIAEVESIRVSRMSVENVAKRGGNYNIYLTAYALLSRSVHSSAGDLEDHLAIDEESKDVVAFRYGPTDAETIRAVGLAGITLSEVLRDIAKDFGEDRSKPCQTFIDYFDGILTATPT
jgi:hypothetical protein